MAAKKKTKKQSRTIARERRIRNAKSFLARLEYHEYEGYSITPLVDGEGDWIEDIETVRISPVRKKF